MMACLVPLLAASLALGDLYPGEHWLRYATPEDAGWSSEKLALAHEVFERAGSDAVMVVYRGAVVVAWGEVDRRFMCHSVRKSFMSALYGIHMAKHEIDPSATLEELGIDDIEPSLTAAEKQARVIDLLASRSGVYHPAAMEPDDMKANRPPRGSHAPGTFFWYNNWDFNTLHTIFEQETGTRFFAEFAARIATPLQMEDFRPGLDAYERIEPENSRHAAYAFKMSARDMARFGLLYLRGGRWRDEQIVPADWVEDSTRAHSEVGGGAGYGYLWWIEGAPKYARYGMYSASGTGGQKIAVLPGLDLVLVHRVNTYGEKSVNFRDLLASILDARTGEPRPDPKLVPLAIEPRTRPATSLTEAELRKLCGRYPLANLPPLRVTLEPCGLVLETFAGKFRLLPGPAADRGTLELWTEDVEQPAVFALDDQGAATALYLEAVHLMDAGLSLERGDVERARKTFADVARYYPRSADAQDGLGAACERAGDRAAARAAYERSLALRPDGRRAQEALKRLAP